MLTFQRKSRVAFGDLKAKLFEQAHTWEELEKGCEGHLQDGVKYLIEKTEKEGETLLLEVTLLMTRDEAYHFPLMIKKESKT